MSTSQQELFDRLKVTDYAEEVCLNANGNVCWSDGTEVWPEEKSAQLPGFPLHPIVSLGPAFTVTQVLQLLLTIYSCSDPVLFPLGCPLYAEFWDRSKTNVQFSSRGISLGLIFSLDFNEDYKTFCICQGQLMAMGLRPGILVLSTASRVRPEDARVSFSIEENPSMNKSLLYHPKIVNKLVDRFDVYRKKLTILQKCKSPLLPLIGQEIILGGSSDLELTALLLEATND